MVAGQSFQGQEPAFSHWRVVGTFENSRPLVHLVEHRLVNRRCPSLLRLHVLLPKEMALLSGNLINGSVRVLIVPTKARENDRQIRLTVLPTPLQIFPPPLP